MKFQNIVHLLEQIVVGMPDLGIYLVCTHYMYMYLVLGLYTLHVSAVYTQVFTLCSLYPPRTKFRGVYRNHSVCPSVRLSVRPSVCPSVCLSVRLQIRVRPITFLWFDIGLPYLAHGCITIRQCVAYIHDPDLTFDLKVKFIGFMTLLCVQD